MKLKALLKTFAALLIALLALYAGRVLGLYLIGGIFSHNGVNADNLANASEWIGYLAENADAIANLCALMCGVCACLFLKDMFSKRTEGFKLKYVYLLPLGAVPGYMLVNLLKSADEIRMPLTRSFGNPIAWANLILFCCLNALLMRSCVCEGLKTAFSKSFAIGASALAEAAFLPYICYGSFSALLVINGLLLGGLMGYVYFKTGSVLPEIFICTGFTLGHRLLGGYPDGGAYYVSNNIITGGEVGITGSVTLTLLIAIACALIAYGERRRLK